MSAAPQIRMDESRVSESSPKTPAYGSFLNPGIVLVKPKPTDTCASYWDEEAVSYYQSDDGPTHLVIGRLASEEQLARAAARWHLDDGQLREFRDGSQQRAIVREA